MRSVVDRGDEFALMRIERSTQRVDRLRGLRVESGQPVALRNRLVPGFESSLQRRFPSLPDGVVPDLVSSGRPGPEEREGDSCNSPGAGGEGEPPEPANHAPASFAAVSASASCFSRHVL